MSFKLVYALSASVSILTLASSQASAQKPQDEIIVSDTRRDALNDARAFVESRPGNVELIPAEAFAERYAVSLRDALAYSPGVVMQPSFGEDGRLSVRGSALAQNFHLRGVELILNGVPINAADGFGDFQEIDLLFSSHINVLRGANAMATGAAAFGGAIEIETQTARTAAQQFSFRAEGGSFGTSRVNGMAARDFGRFDALAGATWQRQDGFRNHAQQRNERFYANIGANWSERTQTRIGVFLSDIDQEIAGSVSLTDALDNPQAAAPANIAQDWQRDMKSVRAFMTTEIDLDAGVFTFGGSYARKDLYHPIVVFILQDSDDFTGFARYSHSAELMGRQMALAIGMRYRFTDLDSRVFGNFGGAKGPLFSSSRQRSETVEGFGEARIEIMNDVEAVAGVALISTVRNFDDRVNDIEDDRLRFKQASPRFGLLARPNENMQIFFNASASYEPPTFNDLTQAGIAGFTPISAQDAFTYELGARGRIGDLEFEAALYRADIDGEFVAFTTLPGVPAPIFNADDTRHQGVEAYLSYMIAEAGGLSIRPRISYSFNDFRFVDDPVYRDNLLAGLPRHIGRAEIEVKMHGLKFSPNVTFQSGRNFVDYANTLSSPGHALIGAEAAFAASEKLSFFIDARNLANEGYIANYSTLANASVSTNTNVFVPGEGRAVFAGLRLGFGEKQ